MKIFKINNRVKLIICAAVLIVWIALMLILSSQNGTQTARVSGSLSFWLTRMIFGESELYAKWQTVHTLIRRAAHIFLFAVMSALVAEFISCFEKAKTIFCAAAAVCIGSLFSLADEWHKLFIDGRHFDMFDVKLNIIGVLIGTAIFLAIRFLIARKTVIHKNKN